MGKVWFLLSLLGLLWAGLQDPLKFELEPRNLTFAYPVTYVITGMGQDVEYFCYGWEALSQEWNYENAPASWGACEDTRNRADVIKEVKVNSGRYDFYLETYNWRGDRLDYRVKRAEVK